MHKQPCRLRSAWLDGWKRHHAPTNPCLKPQAQLHAAFQHGHAGRLLRALQRLQQWGLGVVSSSVSALAVAEEIHGSQGPAHSSVSAQQPSNQPHARDSQSPIPDCSAHCAESSGFLGLRKMCRGLSH